MKSKMWTFPALALFAALTLSGCGKDDDSNAMNTGGGGGGGGSPAPVNPYNSGNGVVPTTPGTAMTISFSTDRAYVTSNGITVGTVPATGGSNTLCDRAANCWTYFNAAQYGAGAVTIGASPYVNQTAGYTFLNSGAARTDGATTVSIQIPQQTYYDYGGNTPIKTVYGTINLSAVAVQTLQQLFPNASVVSVSFDARISNLNRLSMGGIYIQMSQSSGPYRGIFLAL